MKNYLVAGVILWVAVIAAYSSQVRKEQAQGENSYDMTTYQAAPSCSSSSSSSSGE